MSDKGEACCADDTHLGVDLSTAPRSCVAEFSLTSSCLEFNPDNFKCKKCSTGKYVSFGVCCPPT